MGGPTDFNDLAAVAGLDAVRSQVERAGPAEPGPQWPDPILPGQMRTPDLPCDVLPAWMADMAQAVSRATQTPPALAVMTSLAVLATALQGRFELEVLPSYREPLSLWTLATSPPGSRKTAVLSALMAPLTHWEKLARDRLRREVVGVAATRAVAKKRIERLLQDAAKAKDGAAREAIRAEVEREESEMPAELFTPRLFTSDVTSERLQALLVEQAGRMAVLSDEGGIFLNLGGLYSGGSANFDVFLQAHAGSSVRVDRAGRTAHIDKPALTLGLLMQPGTLSDLASSRRFRDSGLLARVLYAMPASNVGQRDVRRHCPIPDEIQQGYERGLTRLLLGLPCPAQAPKLLTMAAAARELWFDLAQDIEGEQGEGGRFESISDWTSKLPGAAARIAALFELGDTGLDAGVVGAGAMERAVRLARLLIPHAQAAFGILGTDAVEIDAAAILKWIRAGERQSFTRREAQKAQEGRFRNVERLQKALERLGHQDVVREFKRANRGAPPTTCYAVNPKVYDLTLSSESSIRLEAI